MPIDVVSFGETMLRLTSPAGTRLEAATQLNVYVGGSESNTLACLSRLKLKTSWLSALPTNPLGRHIDGELRSHGVDTSQIVWTGQGTRLGTYFVEEATQPLGTQVYYDRASSACAQIDPNVLDYTIIDNARLLHLTGITPALGEGSRGVFRRLLERARSKEIPLSFDVNYRAKLWSPQEAAASVEEACQQAHILFCTSADAAELWGFRGSPEEVLRQIAHKFPGDERRCYVLTLGAEGSAHLRGQGYAQEPIFPSAGTIRFGSGDAFSAGYLYAYLEGPHLRGLNAAHPPITPLTVGNALAALKRCIAGDIAIIQPEELLALLQRSEGARFR